MSKNNEIGGYIEFDFPNNGHYWVGENVTCLNSARNAIRYILRTYNIKEIFVPFYTCPVVWDAIKDEGCKINFYEIDENFMPKNRFNENDYILYTNYFGICNKNSKKLSEKYKSIVFDNAQAFYANPMGIGSAYSPRKFFGCPDGGYAICDKAINLNFEHDVSWDRCIHLLKRVDVDSNYGYNDFNVAEETLNHAEMKLMSNLTNRILSSIDYESAKLIRRKNFEILHKNLKEINELKFEIDDDDVPMYYPFLISKNSLRQKFIDKNIFVPTCWKNMDKFFCCEYPKYEAYLQTNLIPLFVDQRYDYSDMMKMIEVIYEN